MKNTKFIIVDGSNVANFKKNSKKKAKFSNLNVLQNYFMQLQNKFNFSYEIINDATLRYTIDKEDKLEKAYHHGTFIQSPKGIKTDEFLIEFYLNNSRDTIIISNDEFSNYPDFKKMGPTIYKFAILFDQIFIPGLEKELESCKIIKETTSFASEVNLIH